MRKSVLFSGPLVAGSALLLLAGCDNTPDAPVEEATIGDEVVPTEPMIPVVTLTPAQQERRDALDMGTYEQEFTSYVDEDRERIRVTGDPDDLSNNNMASEGNMSGTRLGIAGSSDFDVIDRNDDGKLSVAEYAIYAVDLRPLVQGDKDDQNPPYASADQLNSAADSFFYYDEDGSTYLSESEFQAAKNGMDTTT